MWLVLTLCKLWNVVKAVFLTNACYYAGWRLLATRGCDGHVKKDWCDKLGTRGACKCTKTCCSQCLMFSLIEACPKTENRSVFLATDYNAHHSTSLQVQRCQQGLSSAWTCNLFQCPSVFPIWYVIDELWLLRRGHSQLRSRDDAEAENIFGSGSEILRLEQIDRDVY